MARRLPRWVWVLGGIVALAVVLRVWQLGERSLWLDELFTQRHVDGDFGHLVARMDDEDSAPLYPILAWLWSRPFGVSEVGLRSLPALLGVATVPVVWAAAAQVGGRRAAVFASVLAAVSPFLVWHSQDARPYALLILLTAVGFLAFLRVLDGGPRWWLGVWAGSSALALATHYDAAFPIAVEAVWLFLARPVPRLRVVAATAIPVAIGLLLLPLAVQQSGGGFAGGGLGGDAGGSADPSLSSDDVSFLGIRNVSSLARNIAAIGGQFVTGYQPRAQAVTVAIGVALLAIALAVVLRTVPRATLRRPAIAIAVGLATILLPILLTPTGFNQVYTRFQSPAHVPLLVGLGAALALASRRAAVPVLAAAGALGIAITVATATDPKFGHQDWRTALDATGRSAEPRLLVFHARYAYEVIPAMRPGSRLLLDGSPPVREVVSITFPLLGSRAGWSPRPPRPDTLPPPPAGFRLVERRLASTYTLLRYRAARPTAVAEADAEALGLGEPDRPPTLALLPPG